MITVARGRRRRAAALLLAVTAGTAGVLFATAGASAAPVTPSAVTVGVETYNLDLGADLTPLFQAVDLTSVVRAAGTVYATMQASLPAERMAAVANVIAESHPDVIGLQEVAEWQTAPYTLVTTPYGPVPVLTGGYTTTYDFLAMLRDDLAALGMPYEVASSDVTFDSGTAVPTPIPISTSVAARYIDRNVVLVSRNLTQHATLSGAAHDNYDATFDVSVAGMPVHVTRGWASVDVTERGRTFRFIDTHLEAYGLTPLKDEVRNPQAVELAGIVADSPYPTVVVGDINARPTMCEDWRQPPEAEDQNTVAYADLQDAGLTEVWPMVYPDAPCDPASWTSGQDSLVGPTSTLSHRIDDVFVTAGFSALSTTVVGDTPPELSTPHGLWPSDHASTVAQIRLNAAP